MRDEEGRDRIEEMRIALARGEGEITREVLDIFLIYSRSHLTNKCYQSHANSHASSIERAI